MEIDPATLSPRDAYRTMIACLVPRPIAWVSTLDAAGRANLAPFSYFGGLASVPPTVMVSVGRRKGVPKDTARNLLATGEAVVHVPSRALAAAMVATSADVPPETDEFDLARLARVASVRVKPWRVVGAPIAMEAKVVAHHEVGLVVNDVFFLEVVRYHLDDAVLVDGLPDPQKLDAVGRLGGASYCGTTDVFTLERPAP